MSISNSQLQEYLPYVRQMTQDQIKAVARELFNNCQGNTVTELLKELPPQTKANFFAASVQ